MDCQQWEQDATEKQQKVAELEQEVAKVQQELEERVNAFKVCRRPFAVGSSGSAGKRRARTRHAP